MDSLRDRYEEYESAYAYRLTKRLPLIIKLKLKNIKRLSANLDKPFCTLFYDVMSNTMLYTITSIQDAVFGYFYHDTIIFILKNDKFLNYEPWYQNNLQRIISSVSSFATIGFYRSTELFGDGINLIGEGTFETNIFALPNITEVLNYIILNQRDCRKLAVTSALQAALQLKMDKNKVLSILKDKSYEDKIDILKEYEDISFLDDYPLLFIQGVATYKIPVFISINNKTEQRNKWVLDDSLPDFLEDKDFLYNILSTGIDISRTKLKK